MITADASVIVAAMSDGGPAGETARDRLQGQHLVEPCFVHLEVMSVLRRFSRTGQVPDPIAGQIVDDLESLPMSEVEPAVLVQRVWGLRHNVTPYDGAYVAVAELYEIPLVTLDKRLAGAPGPRCTFEVL